MNLSLNTFAPRLLAGFGTAGLVAGVGLFASSRPAHTAGGPIAVNVANTVQNSDVDNPARQPFQIHLQPSAATGGEADASFTVPAGKVLVIEDISAGVTPQNSTTGGSVELLTTAGGVTMTHYDLADTNVSQFRQHQMVRYYADPGSKVVVKTFSFTANNDASDAPAGADVELSGYYVNVP